MHKGVVPQNRCARKHMMCKKSDGSWYRRIVRKDQREHPAREVNPQLEATVYRSSGVITLLQVFQ